MVNLINIMDRISEILDVNNIDTEDIRRQKTLNIILFGFTIVSIPAFVLFISFDILGYATNQVAVNRLYHGFLIYGVTMVTVYKLNKKNSLMASTTFLLLFLGIISVSDTIPEIVGGRGLFLFSIPILMSSVLLPPYSSFIFASLSSIIIASLAFSLRIVPDVGGISGFFILATISWLMSRSQKTSFDRLSIINVELDKRVDERTSELIKANAKLQNLSEMKTRFVSTATHELRTPLTSMKGYLELVESEELSPKVSDYLKVVSRNMARLEALTNDLLDQQRIEEGRLEIEKTRFDFSELVVEIEEELSKLMAESNHSLIIKLPNESIQIFGDRLRLHQVFVNLLDNAKKYSPDGSIIQIDVRTNLDHIHVTITDEGIGISQDDISELFKPFPNIDRPFKTKQSVGLGLSISKGIIELHGGTIWAESSGDGEGSKFKFYLPMSAN